MGLGCCPCCRTFILSAWLNISEVANYVTTGTPPPFIAPYPRPFKDSAGDPDSSCGTTDYYLCGPWPVSERPSAATSPNVLRDWNVLEPQDEPDTNVQICIVPGHKVAQARKSWHGALPFGYCNTDSEDEVVCTELTNRYLTIQRHSTLSGYLKTYDAGTGSLTGEIDLAGEIERTISVGQHTGLKNLDSCTEVEFVDAGLPFYTDLTLQLFSIVHGCQLSIPNTTNSPAQTWDTFADWESDPSWNYEIDEPDTYRLVSITFSSKTATKIEGVYSFSQQTYTVDGMGARDALTQDFTAAINFTIELTNAYSAATVLSESVALLDNLELGKIPFRDDTLRSVGVMCVYHEPTPQTPDLGRVDCDYEDELDYTGDIIGIPFEGIIGTNESGHASMFGFDHATFRCFPVDSVDTWFVTYYGAYAAESVIDLSDGVIPPNYSVWTQNYDAGSLYAGSYVFWGVGVDGDIAAANTLLLQKQGEGTQPFPAYNKFGPCGRRRHMVDRNKASCIATATGFETGDTITLSDAIGDGTYDIIFFGTVDTARRFNATVSGTTVVLGAEDANARNVDTALEYWTAIPGINLGSGILGAVRDWKRSGVSFTPPGICGKVAVTVAQDLDEPTKVKVTFASDQKYVQATDKIAFVQGDAADTVNNDNSATGFTLTDAADGYCKFTGTYDPDTMLGYVKIFGAPLAKWNSVSRKRTGVFQSWPDNGDGDFNPTPTNADYTYTGEKILTSTPNTGELDAEFYNVDFPTATATTCGGKALKIPVQYVISPLDLNQIPFGCSAIDVKPPVVESMTMTRWADYVTDGAPELPDGCEFALPTSPPSPAGLDCSLSQPNGIPGPWNYGDPDYEA